MEQKAFTRKGRSPEAILVKDLRTEYCMNPLGIDGLKPRLSWILESSERGQIQTAYQILVSSSNDKLRADIGDVWDTGKVESDQSIHVEYDGKALRSGKQYVWKVRVWDKEGESSSWSKSTMWTMGLLNRSDWNAKWISLNYTNKDDQVSLGLEGAKWIWHPNALPESDETTETVFFRYSFELPFDRQVEWARILITADNSLNMFVNGKGPFRVYTCQQPALLDITNELKEGKNVIAVAATTIDERAGLVGKLKICFDSADPLIVQTGDNWKVSKDEKEGWKEEDFNPSDWAEVKTVASYGEEPWGILSDIPEVFSNTINEPNPYLRKNFQIKKPIQRATIYVTALGLYELHLNGNKVSKDYFSPGWTDYNKRVQYQTYDATDLLVQGENSIGGVLGLGWYAGYVGMFTPYQYGESPCLLVQMNVVYDDGTIDSIVTDESWKGAQGPIIASDMLKGEIYDARKELTGWDTPSFDDSSWTPPEVREDYNGKLVSQRDPSVKVTERLKPVSIIRSKKGAYIFDMGQNMVGWAKLKVNGEAGTKVTLRFVEMLESDDEIYTTNLRNAKQKDVYILKGTGEEVFEPHFTFHGFRYVEVSGLPEKPSPETLTGMVVHSETPPVGQLETSSDMVNQLQRNITWGQRGNFLSVPTDCPQRDERLGWMGDAQIFIRTASYNMDVSSFFTKWMVDVEDAQRSNGAFTDIAPHLGWLGHGNAAWGDAGVIIPWVQYQVYGDIQIAEKHYPAMMKWIEYLKENSDGLLRPDEGFGDWLSINAETPKDVLGTAYFAYSTSLMAKMAKVVGRFDDAKKYIKLLNDIKSAFNEAYVGPDGSVKGNTQTAYVLALYMDLLPDEVRPLAANHLVEDIKKRDWHLSTGFLGVGYLLPVLTEYGHLDVAYQLLNRETYPSWGYSIRHGATTIWERWDGWTEQNGFQDPGMNSFNHYSLGSVGEWLYRYVAGIDLDQEIPGYKQIVIHPRPGGSLNYAMAAYESIHGKIISQWEMKDDSFALNVTIPVNTTATVHVLGNNHSSITEGGLPVSEADDIKFLGVRDGKTLFRVGSGEYKFVSKLNT
jgi:alpha-L-rhamnosidase